MTDKEKIEVVAGVKVLSTKQALLNLAKGLSLQQHSKHFGLGGYRIAKEGKSYDAYHFNVLLIEVEGATGVEDYTKERFIQDVTELVKEGKLTLYGPNGKKTGNPITSQGVTVGLPTAKSGVSKPSTSSLFK
jgi:hypothetical protein